MSHRHTHNIRAADDDDLLAAHVDLATLQQLDAAGGRARQREGRLPAPEAHPADVFRREAVHVLCNIIM